MRSTTDPVKDPLAGRVRKPHFVEIYFLGQRLDSPFLTDLAFEDTTDLRKLVLEAMRANQADQAGLPSRYLLRVYECGSDWHKRPRRGRRLLDYVARDDEGVQGGHGYAA